MTCHNRREAEDALEALRLSMAGMGLQLKQAKTRIVLAVSDQAESKPIAGRSVEETAGRRGVSYSHARDCADGARDA